MVWTQDDIDIVKAKVDELKLLEEASEVWLNRIRDCTRALEMVGSDSASEIDGTVMSDERKEMLKTSLITQADEMIDESETS